MMSDKNARKKILNDYKERPQMGGVYIIRNNVNDNVFIDTTPDIAAIKNRFDFSKQMNSCVFPKLKKDWDAFGCGAFTIEALETIQKNENQTYDEFRDDLLLLKNMWLEKLSAFPLY